MSTKNYYEILELSKDASQNEVKKAYRRLAIQYHPDKNPENTTEAADKFKVIGEAYSVLSDPTQRRQYDEERLYGNSSRVPTRGYDTSRFRDFHPSRDFEHFGGRDPFEIFEEFFKNDPFRDVFGRFGDPFSDMRSSAFDEDFGRELRGPMASGAHRSSQPFDRSSSREVAPRQSDNSLFQFRNGTGGKIKRSVSMSNSTTIRNGKRHTVKKTTIIYDDGTEETNVEESHS
jgi:curved DNA-binding protein CbpA